MYVSFFATILHVCFSTAEEGAVDAGHVCFAVAETGALDAQLAGRCDHVTAKRTDKSGWRTPRFQSPVAPTTSDAGRPTWMNISRVFYVYIITKVASYLHTPQKFGDTNIPSHKFLFTCVPFRPSTIRI